MAAMLVTILKIQVHELGAHVEKILWAHVEKILYAKSPFEKNTENLTLVSDHFEYGGHVGGHFEKEN